MSQVPEGAAAARMGTRDADRCLKLLLATIVRGCSGRVTSSAVSGPAVSRLETALDFVGGVLVLAGLGAVLILALAL